MNPESLGSSRDHLLSPLSLQSPSCPDSYYSQLRADKDGAQFLRVGAQSLWQDQRLLLCAWLSQLRMDIHWLPGYHSVQGRGERQRVGRRQGLGSVHDRAAVPGHWLSTLGRCSHLDGVLFCRTPWGEGSLTACNPTGA